MQVNNFTIKPFKNLSAYNAKVEYKELFFKFYFPIVRFSNMIISEREDAENIVSDIFLQVWKDRKGLSLTPDIKVFLYKETMKISVNYLQQQKCGVNINNLFVVWTLPFKPFGESQVPTEIAKGVEQIIMELPTFQKFIFKLIIEDKLTTVQVASIMDMPHDVTEKHFVATVKKIGEHITITQSPHSNL